MKTAEEWVNEREWASEEGRLRVVEMVKLIQSDARKDLEQERDTLQRELNEAKRETSILRKYIDDQVAKGGDLDTLQRSNAELSAQVERLKEAIESAERYLRFTPHGNTEIDEIIQQAQKALSLTPSDALKEYMKPWVEFVELANQKLKFLLDECDWEGDERIPLAFDGMQDQARQLLASRK